MKNIALFAVMFVLGVSVAVARQDSNSDEAGRLLALEKAWNLALEQKDVKALDMLLAPTFISVESDGSLQSKNEFLAGIKSPDYQPSQAVTEQTNVQVYGDAAVVVGIFRIKAIEKGKMRVRRERFVDTWVKNGASWQCVATTSAEIMSKQGASE
jgi:ketosteroid isomerase-like protein